MRELADFILANKLALAGIVLGAFIIYASLKLSKTLMSIATALLIILIVT